MLWAHLCCEGSKLLESVAPFCGDLTLSDHMRGFNARQRRPGGLKRFEAFHLAGNPFYEPMVLLDYVIQIALSGC